MPLPKSASVTQWVELPVELWVKIMACLPEPDRNNIRLLSKHFRDVVDLPVVWKDVCIKIDIRMGELGNILRRQGYLQLCKKRQYKKILILIDLSHQEAHLWIYNGPVLNDSFPLLKNLLNSFHNLNEITIKGKYFYRKSYDQEVPESIKSYRESLNKGGKNEIWTDLAELFNKLGSIEKLTIDLMLVDIYRHIPRNVPRLQQEPDALYFLMMGIRTVLVEMRFLKHFSLHLPQAETFSPQIQKCFLPTETDGCDMLKLEHLDVQSTVSGPLNEQQMVMLPHLKSYSASPQYIKTGLYYEDIQDYSKMSGLNELNIKCTSTTAKCLHNKVTDKLNDVVLPPNICKLHRTCFDGDPSKSGNDPDNFEFPNLQSLHHKKLRILNVDVIVPLNKVFNMDSLEILLHNIPYVHFLHIRYVVFYDDCPQITRSFYQLYQRISWQKLFQLRNHSESLTKLHLSCVTNIEMLEQTLKLGPFTELTDKKILKAASESVHSDMEIKDCNGTVEITLTPKNKTPEPLCLLPFSIKIDCNVFSVHEKSRKY